MRVRALTITVAAALTATVGLSGCAVDGGSSDAKAKHEVVLVTHDSFALPKQLIGQFEKSSGLKLVVRQNGDAGQLTNKLVLTKADPIGDVAYGVDNTFATRALNNGVFARYTPTGLPAGIRAWDLPGDDGTHLTPVDQGNVCVNIDKGWFASRHVTPPATLDDLTKPAYKGLTVIPGAATSSTGLAFLLATIAKYGESGWQGYWTKLMANRAKLVDGWDQAYEVDFTQGGGKGSYPIVVSYDSSPAYTVSGGATTTASLPQTCFGQVEYAGILAGAKNDDGAKKLLAFLISHPVQAAIPESMYMFPTVPGTALPADWAKYAEQPSKPWTLPSADIDAHRDTWLRQWSDITSR